MSGAAPSQFESSRSHLQVKTLSVAGRGGGGYYFLDDAIPLYALRVYPKNEKTDLSAEDKRAATALVEVIIPPSPPLCSRNRGASAPLID